MNYCIPSITRQSVAVQRDGASRMAKNTRYGNAFLSYFTQKVVIT